MAGRRSLMGGRRRKGYVLAISSGINGSLAAISAKLVPYEVLKYFLVFLFNTGMWSCYINSLKALSYLEAIVLTFATNFLISGLVGWFLFEEGLSYQWFAGASIVTIGVVLLNPRTAEKKERID